MHYFLYLNLLDNLIMLVMLFSLWECTVYRTLNFCSDCIIIWRTFPVTLFLFMVTNLKYKHISSLLLFNRGTRLWRHHLVWAPIAFCIDGWCCQWVSSELKSSSFARVRPALSPPDSGLLLATRPPRHLSPSLSALFLTLPFINSHVFIVLLC